MISILGKSLFSFFSQKDAVQFSMCKVLHNVLLWKKCLSNVDKGGQICVTAVDGMNVPSQAGPLGSKIQFCHSCHFHSHHLNLI